MTIVDDVFAMMWMSVWLTPGSGYREDLRIVIYSTQHSISQILLQSTNARLTEAFRSDW